MQPGPFSNKDSKLYNDIEKMLGELKMPKNPRNKKIKAALNRGADRALDDVTKHGEDVYKKLNRGDHKGAEESEGRSDKALKRFEKRTKATSNEEVEHVEEGVNTTLKFKKDAVAKKAGGKKVSGGYKFEFKNDKEMMKFMDKHADSIAEDTEVEEGKLVDRIMRKRKQMKNKGTIPGSDGY